MHRPRPAAPSRSASRTARESSRYARFEIVLGVLTGWLVACFSPFSTGPVQAKTNVQISAQSSTASISVDIDEPTKPGPDGDGSLPALPQRALEDTIWIADWRFDGASCNGTDWTHYDNRILNDGSDYWSVHANYGGTGGIVNNAAVLAKHDLGWARDGYGNGWDYSVILAYSGAGATLSFDYLSDSEPGYDFVSVEADSAGASEALVDYTTDPGSAPEDFRTVLLVVDGVQNTAVGALVLPDFAVPATTHEVYIRFQSDGRDSDEDGLYPSVWNAGLVVDNIVVTGTLGYVENFESTLNANVSLANTAPATPFGEWARLHQHITDNDKCSENTTCAWLVTDPLRIASFPDMAFGPGSAVIHGWLDDVLVSPWVSLTSSGSASTMLSYRTFPGNGFALGRIAAGWQVRSKIRVDNTDTSTLGDSVDVITPWQNRFHFSTLSRFAWSTAVADLSSGVRPGAFEIQVRFQVTDWQYAAGGLPPAVYDAGPGPYLDRVRIGRRVLAGPDFDLGIDARTQAQDAFATVQNAISPGEHFSPATDIFGSCAFSQGGDLGINGSSPNLITGDSILMRIQDVRGAGGITSVKWYGAITAGPHAGKAPAPYTVGGNGFFEVTPDSSRAASGRVVAGLWAVDLDDTYFRGGDQLVYFWTALDANGGRRSAPQGITGANFPPASVTAAEIATGGLYEASYLPDITWSPAYLARIAADAHGDLDPTPTEISGSSQRNCILYYNQADFNRRSGPLHRTSFMYTLDRLGYRGSYDVYDVQGFGNTNNQLGGRATVAQAAGYALVVEDDGRLADFNLADGVDPDGQKVHQAQWYRDWLASGLVSPPGIHTLWLIGENTAYERRTDPLITVDFGLASVVPDQSLNVNPNVTGVANFTFSNGNSGTFSTDSFSLDGGCPLIRNYDGAGVSGGTITHRYTFGATTGTGAIIMNKNSTLHWNTVWMGFDWFDIRDPFGGSPMSATGTQDIQLAREILDAALPIACTEGEDPTGNGGDDVDAVPAVSILHQNVPNPFNPATRIDFDLARDGSVRLRVFDVSGRLVRTLVDGVMQRGFQRSVTWDGLGEDGQRVPSGVYFYRLETPDLVATRKLVLLK